MAGKQKYNLPFRIVALSPTDELRHHIGDYPEKQGAIDLAEDNNRSRGPLDQVWVVHDRIKNKRITPRISGV